MQDYHIYHLLIGLSQNRMKKLSEFKDLVNSPDDQREFNTEEKEKGEKIDFDEIFNPYKAIEYADFHLDYLTKYLHHPLFIAYAYNGGIGFTRKHIKDGRNFRTGPYEPYMSMEMMENDEAREYGKKVLANYVIYLNKSIGEESNLQKN